MGYKQSKISALNMDNTLGMRYQGLLRCITAICKRENYSFNEVIGKMDTGLNTEYDYDIASEKINKCIGLLDAEKKVPGTLIRWTKSPTKNLERNIELSFDNETSASRKKKTVPEFKSFNFFKWKFFFGIKRLEKEPLSRRDLNIIFRPQYNDLSPFLDIIARDLDELVKKKFKYISNKLAFQPQYRNKSWESILDKLMDMNKKKKNISSLLDIQDLIGFRIVTLFEKDLQLIENIIDKSFNVVRKYQPSYLTRSAGSISKHIVIKLMNKEVNNYLMNGKPSFILIEIQIMTLTQFVFASISHSLLYKNESGTIISMKNSLAEIYSLLEKIENELNDRYKNND